MSYQSKYTGSQIDEGIEKASKALTTPDTAPSAVTIPAIDTNNEQTNLTLGDGLSVADGVLSASGGSGEGGVESVEVLYPIMEISDVTMYEDNVGIAGKGVIVINGKTFNIDDVGLLIPVGYNPEYFQGVKSEDGLSAILDLSESTKAVLANQRRTTRVHSIDVHFDGSLPNEPLASFKGRITFTILTDDTIGNLNSVTAIMSAYPSGITCMCNGFVSYSYNGEFKDTGIPFKTTVANGVLTTHYVFLDGDSPSYITISSTNYSIAITDIYTDI